MADIELLKRLAEAAAGNWEDSLLHEYSECELYIENASPAVVLALIADNERLRQIISDSATSCGAAMSPGCTVEFMGHLPAEIAGVLRLLRAELERARADAERYRWLRAYGRTGLVVRSDKCHLHEVFLDRAIDAAMGKGGDA